ncbi:I78 family peptidase inhibitor [Methylobrevis albus]|uniref:Peptidase inhibitor I78 family protein n=1 Tax=Methylobrevis albus TaxID=2793297 RepID=A0A931HZP4_9HYPH|nr:I78 family peptidase inhibitor [Methylobrevis albus]MBH0236669.1 hypothetical protein [Methylobrevis albus]
MVSQTGPHAYPRSAPFRRPVVFSLLAVLLAGCVSAPSGYPGDGPYPYPPPQPVPEAPVYGGPSAPRYPPPVYQPPVYAPPGGGPGYGQGAPIYQRPGYPPVYAPGTYPPVYDRREDYRGRPPAPGDYRAQPPAAGYPRGGAYPPPASGYPGGGAYPPATRLPQDAYPPAGGPSDPNRRDDRQRPGAGSPPPGQQSPVQPLPGRDAPGAGAGSGAGTGAGAPPAAARPSGRCSAGPASSVVGKRTSQSTVLEAQQKSGANAVRVVKPNEIKPEDYNGDRLNLVTGEGQTIVRVECG